MLFGTVSMSSEEDEELMLLLFSLLFGEPLIKSTPKARKLSTKKRQKYSLMLENDL